MCLIVVCLFLAHFKFNIIIHLADGNNSYFNRAYLMNIDLVWHVTIAAQIAT